MEEKTCRICGKTVNTDFMGSLSDGSTACLYCVEAEKKQTETEAKENTTSEIKSQKKKKKALLISAISLTCAIVLLLVFFIPFTTTESCSCYGGLRECNAKIFAEKLSGKPIYNHDCGLCSYGYIECTSCHGTGARVVHDNLFNRLF